MQKWEYTRVEVTHHATIQFYDQRNNRMIDLEINDVLTDMGENGWELAGCGSMDGGSGHILYFKKPKD